MLNVLPARHRQIDSAAYLGTALPDFPSPEQCAGAAKPGET